MQCVFLPEHISLLPVLILRQPKLCSNKERIDFMKKTTFKLLAITLTTAILFALFPVGIIAETEPAANSFYLADLHQTCQGFTVTLGVNTTGLSSISYRVSFDNTKLYLVKASTPEDFRFDSRLIFDIKEANQNGYFEDFADAFNSNVNLEGELSLITMTFQLKGEATENTTNIKAELKFANDMDLNDIIIAPINEPLSVKLAHNFVDATCIAPKYCLICGMSEGYPLGHTPGEEATCTADQVCTVCGEILIPKTNHLWVDGTVPGTSVCRICGAVKNWGLIWGDATGDGTVTSADSVLIKRYLADWHSQTAFNPTACDLNKNGEVEATESVVVSRYLAGWKNLPYPVGEPLVPEEPEEPEKP